MEGQMAQTKTGRPRHTLASLGGAHTVVVDLQDRECWLDELVELEALITQAVISLPDRTVPADARGVKAHVPRAPFGAVAGMFEDMPDAVAL